MSLLTTIRNYFIPMYEYREARHLMVKSLKLPVCPYEFDSVTSKAPLSVHPELDKYLTITERQQLLIAAGWIKPVDGKAWQITKYDYRPIINNWVTNGGMKHIKPEWTLEYTGELNVI